MNHNFNVGDSVIINNPELAPVFSDEHNLTIKEINSAGNFNICLNLNKGRCYWVSSDDIDLATEAKPATESNSVDMPSLSTPEPTVYVSTTLSEEQVKILNDALKPIYADSTPTTPTPSGYMVFVENQSKPKHIHPTYTEAVTEAHRLAKQSQNINYKVYILAVLSAVVGTVSVDEVAL